MGSGKSTVGKIISSELFLNFFDTDEEIETRTGASIDWIFDLEGEEGFRKRESNILKELSNIKNTVVGTGGGIIISHENREVIKNLGFVVYLTASIKELTYRTEQDKSRPLINSANTQEVIANLIKERQEYYEKTSNIKISTDNYDTVKISKIIIKDYEKNNS